MKCIVFIILVLVSTRALPQNFEMGIDVGEGFNTAPVTTSYYQPVKKPSALSLCASAEALWVLKKWHFGLETGLNKLTSSYNVYQGSYYVVNGHLVEIFKKSEVASNLSDPAIPLKALADVLILHKKKYRLYLGVSSGVVFLDHASIGPTTALNFPGNANTGWGFTGGAHAGFTYYITGHFGINAKADCNFMHLSIGNVNNNLFYFPFTVGVRYRP